MSLPSIQGFRSILSLLILVKRKCGNPLNFFQEFKMKLLENFAEEVLTQIKRLFVCLIYSFTD